MIPFPFPKDETITRAMLEVHFGNDANYEISPGDSESTESTFPDGLTAAFCSHYAVQVKRELGECAQIYGFPVETNPASEIAQKDGGHDFAVVNGRYIVDQWANECGGYTVKAVLDLTDPKDKDDIERLYGLPSVWLNMRNEALEAEANKPVGKNKPRP